MDVTGDQVERVKRRLLRNEFDQALVNLVGRQLSTEEAERTESLLSEFEKAGQTAEDAGHAEGLCQ